MLAEAVRSSSDNWRGWTLCGCAPADLPGGFDTHSFWLKLLRDWDSLPVTRLAHMELWGASHITGKTWRHPSHIRRLAITLPLAWALRVLAGTTP